MSTDHKLSLRQLRFQSAGALLKAVKDEVFRFGFGLRHFNVYKIDIYENNQPIVYRPYLCFHIHHHTVELHAPDQYNKQAFLTLTPNLGSDIALVSQEAEDIKEVYKTMATFLVDTRAKLEFPEVQDFDTSINLLKIKLPGIKNFNFEQYITKPGEVALQISRGWLLPASESFPKHKAGISMQLYPWKYKSADWEAPLKLSATEKDWCATQNIQPTKLTKREREWVEKYEPLETQPVIEIKVEAI